MNSGRLSVLSVASRPMVLRACTLLAGLV